MIALLAIIWHNFGCKLSVLFKRLTGRTMRIPTVPATGLIDVSRVRFFSLVRIGKMIYANLEVDGLFVTCPATADLIELLNNSFSNVRIMQLEPGEISTTVVADNFIEPLPKPT